MSLVLPVYSHTGPFAAPHTPLRASCQWALGNFGRKSESDSDSESARGRAVIALTSMLDRALSGPGTLRQ
jgi:hypothetical protein